MRDGEGFERARRGDASDNKRHARFIIQHIPRYVSSVYLRGSCLLRESTLVRLSSFARAPSASAGATRGEVVVLRFPVFALFFAKIQILGLWRHQTGWIFSSGYGSSRLWTRAAPPPIRFARRRLQKICRSPSFEHVVPSAFVLKRRICDVIAPLPTRGVRKQKRHNSRNPTSQPVFDWLDFHPREIQPVFALGRACGRARESSMGLGFRV